MRRTRSPTWAARVFWRPRAPQRRRRARSSPLGVRLLTRYRIYLWTDTEAPIITSSIKYLDPSIHSVNTVANLACLPNVGKASSVKGQGSSATRRRHSTHRAHSSSTASHLRDGSIFRGSKHLNLNAHVSQRAGAATDSAEHAPSWTNASNQPKTSVEAPPGGATTRVAVRATA